MITGDFAASRPRPLGDRRVELLGGHDPVDDPRRERLLRAQALAQQQQLVGLLARDVAVDQRHDHERERAHVDLGRAERRLLGGDDQVARERDPERAREHVPARGADVGLPSAPISVNSPDEALGAEVLVHERHVRREAAEVGARGEHLLVRGGQHHAAHARRRRGRARSAPIKPSSISAESALRVSGSFSVIVATPASASS